MHGINASDSISKRPLHNVRPLRESQQSAIGILRNKTIQTIARAENSYILVKCDGAQKGHLNCDREFYSNTIAKRRAGVENVTPRIPPRERETPDLPPSVSV